MCVLNYDRLGSKEHKLEGEVSTPPGNEGDLCRRWQIIRRTDGCSFDIEGGEGGELGEGAGTEGQVRRMLAMNESLLHLAKQRTADTIFKLSGNSLTVCEGDRTHGIREMDRKRGRLL